VTPPRPVVPIVAVTGTNGKTTVTRLIAHLYESAGYAVGMTSTEGIYVDRERVLAGDCSGPRSAREVLDDPRVEVAVLETARGGILRDGLAFAECEVAVVTNVSRDHMGLDGVETLDDLAAVKRVVVEHVARHGAAVLNADDRRVAAMAAHSPGEVIYFSTEPDRPLLGAHRRRGGRCVVARAGQIVLAAGRETAATIDLESVPFTAGGRIGFQVQNALAATAAAWAGRLDPSTIAGGLATFSNDAATNPGRFNVSDVDGVQVVVDYAHNEAALAALGQALTSLGPRRTVALLGPPGDRPDEDLLASLRATLGYVDLYVLHDPNPRGRPDGDVPRLLAAHLPPGVPHRFAGSREEGIGRAWHEVLPGDRLLLFADRPEDAHAILRRLSARSGAARLEAARPATPERRRASWAF
jgi:cyanophycin synthetase